MNTITLRRQRDCRQRGEPLVTRQILGAGCPEAVENAMQYEIRHQYITLDK